MTQYTGEVKKVFEKKGRYTLLMDDENWYGLGFKKPNIQGGDMARFTYTKNGDYNNVDDGSLESKANPTPKKADSGGRKKAGGGGASDYAKKEQYWADKEQRDIDVQMKISYNAAINTSINVINSALDREFFKIPGGKKASLDAYMAAVYQQAAILYKDFQSVPKMHEELMAEDEPADQQMPADMGSEETEEEPQDEGGWG